MSIHEQEPRDNKTGVNPADLPPLEPTAAVPPVHSDKLNDPEYWRSKYQEKSAKVPRRERDTRLQTTDTPWYQKTAVKVGGAVAGLVAVGGAIAGVAASGNNEATPNETRPTASAPANPGETGSVAPQPEADPASGPFEFGIDASEFAGNPELLAKEFNRQNNQYWIAGADEKAAKADERFTMTLEEYVTHLSSEIDAQFIEEMFVPNWEENPELAEFVNTNIKIAHGARQLRIATYTGGEEDLEPYVRETIIDEAIGTVDPLVTNTRWHERDNRDKNTVETMLEGSTVDPNTQTGGTTFTWEVIDGQAKISGVSYFDGKQ